MNLCFGRFSTDARNGVTLKAAGTWLVVAGLLTTVRAIVEQFEPAYYSPVTALDYTAAILTTVMWLSVGIGLILYWRASPTRRGAVLVLAGAVGVSVAAVGNFLEDVVRVPFSEWLFLVGLSAGALALLVGGIMILSVSDKSRWVGLFLIFWVAGGVAPDRWGEFVSALSLLGLGIWLLTVGQPLSSATRT